MTDDLSTRAALLVDALEAAGHPPGATGIARIASERGFAPATTVRLLRATSGPAADLAVAMFGAAAESESLDPGLDERTPARQMNDEMRAQLGVVPLGDEPEVPPAQRTPTQQVNHDLRVAAGFAPLDDAS